MKKIALIAATSMFLTGAAAAADMSMPVKAPEPEPTPLWDVSFGVTGTSDYIFRGVSQTNGNPAVQGFAELSLFDWFYAGVWGSNVSFLNSGSAEVDVYGGLRHTWGGLTLDAGIIGYLYPGSENDTDLNYWEVYFKPSYAVTDWLTVGANLYYTTDYAATSTDGTYLSGTAKVTLPTFGPFGWYASGEFGHQWLDGDYFNAWFPSWYGPTYVDLSGYNYWNAGLGFTYKAATLDLRYHGSDLSDNECYMLSSFDNCGNRFVASLSFQTSFNQLK